MSWHGAYMERRSICLRRLDHRCLNTLDIWMHDCLHVEEAEYLRGGSLSTGGCFARMFRSRRWLDHLEQLTTYNHPLVDLTNHSSRNSAVISTVRIHIRSQLALHQCWSMQVVIERLTSWKARVALSASHTILEPLSTRITPLSSCRHEHERPRWKRIYTSKG